MKGVSSTDGGSSRLLALEVILLTAAPQIHPCSALVPFTFMAHVPHSGVVVHVFIPRNTPPVCAPTVSDHSS